MKASGWANILKEGQAKTISDQKRPESDQIKWGLKMHIIHCTLFIIHCTLYIIIHIPLSSSLLLDDHLYQYTLPFNIYYFVVQPMAGR